MLTPSTMTSVILKPWSVLREAPVDPDRRTVGGGKSGWDTREGRIAVAARSHHLQLLARVLIEAHGIGVHDVALEQLGEFLALLVGGRAPVGSEDEPRDRRNIEAFIEQGAELPLAIAFARTRRQDGNRAVCRDRI